MSVFTLNENIESIAFKVSNEKSIFHLSDLDKSIADYYEEQSPDLKYATKFVINMFATDWNEANIMDIGFAEGIYFEAEFVFSVDINFTELCDMISGNAYSMAEAITDKHGNIQSYICPQDYNIVYIDKVFIEKECRGLGIGKYLFENLKPLLTHSLNAIPHSCIVKPYPQEKTQYGMLQDVAENLEHEQARLNRFYKNVGFMPINKTGFMYKKLGTELWD